MYEGDPEVQAWDGWELEVGDVAIAWKSADGVVRGYCVKRVPEFLWVWNDLVDEAQRAFWAERTRKPRGG